MKSIANKNKINIMLQSYAHLPGTKPLLNIVELDSE